MTATRRADALAMGAIRAVAASAILAVFLVVVFLAREALPIFVEDVDLAALVAPQTWPHYASSAFVWQPVGSPPKMNIVPLFIGSLKTTVLATLIAAPVAIAAAIYTVRLASPWVREVCKPAVELLASVPSVVLGFFALTSIASIADALGATYRLNALVAAAGLAIAVAPIIYTLAEDALAAVPAPLAEAAVALGAREWQVTLRVLVPAALPGIMAAVLLGTGRALGETMIVLMASGNASVLEPFDPTSSARTITATIASELGEVAHGTPHFRVLFLLGLLLFGASLALQRVGAWWVRRIAVRRGLDR